MKQFTLIAILFAILLTGCGRLSDDGSFLTIRSADPRLNFHVRLLTPVPMPTGTLTELPVEPTATPEEVGELLPDPLPTPPCEVLVKSNIGRTGKIYHLPGMANYDQVRIDESKGEFFHCSEQEAIDAGFRKALR